VVSLDLEGQIQFPQPAVRPEYRRLEFAVWPAQGRGRNLSEPALQLSDASFTYPPGVERVNDRIRSRSHFRRALILRGRRMVGIQRKVLDGLLVIDRYEARRLRQHFGRGDGVASFGQLAAGR